MDISSKMWQQLLILNIRNYWQCLPRINAEYNYFVDALLTEVSFKIYTSTLENKNQMVSELEVCVLTLTNSMIDCQLL